MKRSLSQFSFVLMFALAMTGCENLQESTGTSDSENTESSDEASEDNQDGDNGSTSTAPVDQGSDDADTATEDANGEAGGDSGEGSGSDGGEPNWGDEESDWDGDDDWDDDHDWDDEQDPWEDNMDGPGPGEECFQACEMALEENLYACDPDGEWEGSEGGEGNMPPPPEEPQADPIETETEEDSEDASDGWDGDDACSEEAFAEFHGCIEQCAEENGWDGGPGPHPGPLSCEERCDYFAEDIMWMCMHEVGNEEECAELSEHAHMICIDECDEHDGPGGPGGGPDHPDHDHDHGPDDHDDHDDHDDETMVGVFECGNQMCAMWQEYCQTVYPGQPQGQTSYQCLPLPDQCEPEGGYCTCFEVVEMGAGVCEEDNGMVYVTVYAP